MTVPTKTRSQEYLIACMAYCMTWEMTGARAPDHWELIHDFVAGNFDLSERQQWKVELYEEGPPSAQEERSIISRIDAYLLQPRDVAYFRSGVLNLLPETQRDAAAKHSLMRSLEMPPSDYGTLKAWVMSWKVDRYQAPEVRQLPLASRENEFNRFLGLPNFVEAFRLFWRVEPKRRDNRQTRVLVCLGAALSQMVQVEETVDFQRWTDRLASICHFTPQTARDLQALMEEMSAFSYDVQELSYQLLVDSRDVDKQNFRNFIERYREDLSELAPVLARGLQFEA